VHYSLHIPELKSDISASIGIDSAGNESNRGTGSDVVVGIVLGDFSDGDGDRARIETEALALESKNNVAIGQALSPGVLNLGLVVVNCMQVQDTRETRRM
jgi:hypothetical protein